MAEQRQTNRQGHSLYVPVDFYLLRAPALPAQVFTQMSNAGHISPGELREEMNETVTSGRQSSYQQLLAYAARPGIKQAIAVASPSLQRGLERLQRGEESPRRQKRMYASLLRYLIRMSTRPTPFGLFSGVALGTFAEETGARLGTPALARFRTRPDMQWLLNVLKKVEENRELLTQLQLQLNQTAYLAGERAMLPFSDAYGQSDYRAVSIRATAAVSKVFELAQRFIPYAQLCMELQMDFPRASGAQIERLLWQLWENGFLISQLHPPLTDAQPAVYILKHLNELTGIDQIQQQLSQVLERAEILDRAGIGAEISLIEKLVQNQEALLPQVDRERLPLQVDGSLNIQRGTLHHSIGQAAAQAGAFLLRQTPRVDGYSHLREYRILFLEKYGEQAEVPLLDLLSPENGLDAPLDYQCPPPFSSRPSSPGRESSVSRDQLLLGLEHPDVARPLNNLADLYLHLGQYEQAEPFCQRALSLFERALGPEHPDVAALLETLATIYREWGKYEQARTLYQRALHLFEMSLGPEHPKVVFPLKGLAIISSAWGEYKAADSLYERALRIQQQALGPEHPETARLLAAQSKMYEQRGRWEQAEPLLQRACAILTACLGQDHPETVETVNEYQCLRERAKSCRCTKRGDTGLPAGRRSPQMFLDNEKRFERWTAGISRIDPPKQNSPFSADFHTQMWHE